MHERHDGWSEPTAALPLRWGSYRVRYLGSVALVVGGALVVQAGSSQAEYLLSIGFIAHIVGLLVLPARGLRRASVALPSALMVSALLLGTVPSILLAGALACWLYLRQRPALSYLATLLPLVSGLVLAQFFPTYGNGMTVVGVSLVVVVLAAWIARSIARSRPLLR